MAEGARQFVANLRYSKGESTRHTGPSTMFRYLYQAGYEWLGAEQMYGPEEIIISALRGASRAYSCPLFGSLHAMQWGSFPFTDPKHALRHYMSLAVAYMHGSSHINTEEALWTDEYAHDRYSESGKAHLFSQHQILDYIETHTRRGDLQSRIAVIQGRNDAWKSFVRGSVWSQEGEKWKFNQACESFDLLIHRRRIWKRMDCLFSSCRFYRLGSGRPPYNPSFGYGLAKQQRGSPSGVLLCR